MSFEAPILLFIYILIHLGKNVMIVDFVNTDET